MCNKQAAQLSLEVQPSLDLVSEALRPAFGALAPEQEYLANVERSHIRPSRSHYKTMGTSLGMISQDFGRL